MPPFCPINDCENGRATFFSLEHLLHSTEANFSLLKITRFGKVYFLFSYTSKYECRPFTKEAQLTRKRM